MWAVLPQGNAKALDLDTALATPGGWTTMRDVRPGDLLLGSDGRPTTVKLVSPVMIGRPCYEVKFSDGSTVIADAEHLWAVQRHDIGYDKPRTYTTQQMVDLGVTEASGVKRFRIPVAVREGAEKALPVDPYTLGAWLGDGASDCGRITNVDEHVWGRISKAYEVGPLASTDRARTHTAYGLKVQLRNAGVLESKSIPDAYFTASIDQRMALAQGLMDADGTVSKAGQVSIGLMDRRLAEDVRRLMWSLGRPTYWDVDAVVVNAKDYGPIYRMTIACDQRHPILSLPRKLERLKGSSKTADHRRIVAITPVVSRPVKCVQVDSLDSLYLAGEAMVPTHNTTLMAAVALYHADFIPNPWVPIGAASREQAEILFAQAQNFVMQTPELSDRFRVYEGYRKIVPLDTSDRPGSGRGIKVYAADEKTGDGVIPTMAIVDEGHRHKNLGLYRLWRGKLRKRTINKTWQGKLEPRRGTIIMISTAGEPGADFERTREALRTKATTRERRGRCYLRAEGPTHVLHEYSVPSMKDAYDLEIVKEANPLMTISVADLAEVMESPSLDFGEDWLRLTCNIPARSSKAAISELDWDRAYTDERIPEGEPVAVGADFAWVLDTTALVPMWIRDVNFRLLGEATILSPPGNGVMLDPEDVHEAFRIIHARNPIYMVVMDMTKAQETAQWLQDELGVEKIVDRTQNNTHAAEDYESFTEGLRGSSDPEARGRIPWLRHVGDPGLTSHIMHAIARKLPGDRYRFDRPAPSRSEAYQDTRVIDALQSAAMVHRTAVAEMMNVDPMPLVAVVAR